MTGNDAEGAAIAKPDTRLCGPLEVLGALAHEILAAMDKRVLGEPARMAVNLAALASAERHNLAPASACANRRLSVLMTPTVVPLVPDAVAPLAELCHMTPATLTAILRTVASGRR
jgi:hypothetical protein